MRNVCGCTPASSAATEITYSARSLSVGGITSPLLVRGAEQRGARVLVEHLGESLDGVALLVVQPHRHLHVDGDEQVAGLVLSVSLHAVAADAEDLARG